MFLIGPHFTADFYFSAEKLNPWLYKGLTQLCDNKGSPGGLDTLQWSKFTCNTNNSPFHFNTPVSESPAVSQPLHQHWPHNTN